MEDTKEKMDDLQFQEQLFGILANVMSDIFMMFSPQKDQPDYVSPNVERILGIPREEVKQNMRVLDCEDPDDREADWDVLKEIPIDGNKTFDVKRIHRLTKETLWFHDTVYHINVWDEEKFVVILSDRTAEHKSQEELVTELDVTRTANDAKSAFLSNMSHDIRTPMNAIVGLTSLLERDADNPEIALDYVHKISASGQQMLDLLDDVLDMSKIESGKTELTVTEINLAVLIDEIYAFLRPRFKVKNQSFEVMTEGAVHEIILGDRVRLNQILVNILSNAIKYTHPNGRIRLKIAETEQTETRGKYRFTITDNGIGISSDFQKVIFEPFTREESPFINSTQGAGLGLSITKNLVELMGGSISVQSRPGMGSSFFVDVEFEHAEEKPEPDFWKKSGISKMLVADNDENLRNKVKKGMDGTGVNLCEADTEDRAIEMISEAHAQGEDFDLILLGTDISDTEIKEVADRIRQIVPPASLILSANAFHRTDDEEKIRKIGINGILSIPFFMTNFQKTVDRVLNEGSRVAEEIRESVLKGRRILIVEDNELNADIIAELIELRGATCQMAENGQAALRCFENAEPNEFDAIFMDVQMPVMDGYEATKAIRTCRNSDGKDIPIIAMTAKAFTGDIHDSLNAGMDAYITKPIDMKILELTLREVWKL